MLHFEASECTPKNIKALKKRLMQLRHFNERVSTELSESIREYEKEKWDIKGWNMWELSSYKGNSCNFLQQNYTCTNSFLVRLVCDRNQLLVSVLYQNENFTEFARYYFIYFTKIQHLGTLSFMPLSYLFKEKWIHSILWKCTFWLSIVWFRNFEEYSLAFL